MMNCLPATNADRVCVKFLHLSHPRPYHGAPNNLAPRRLQIRLPQSRREHAFVLGCTKARVSGIVAKQLRPVVERFRIQHEKAVSEERLKSLGVSRWSKWECGPFVTTYWKWDTDEMVYISKGCLEFVPWGCEDSAFFYAGDLVHFPKWLEGNVSFNDDYEQYYKFLAYGD